MESLNDQCIAHVTSFLNPWDVRTLSCTSKTVANVTGRRLRDAHEAMDMLPWNAGQALDALIRTGLVAPTPDGIANFIRQAQLHRTGTKIICKLLTPQRFEGVLGSEAAWKAAKPAAVSYMKSSFDFDGMTVVEALRTVLLQVSAPQSTRSVSFLLRMTSARFFHSAVLTHPGTPIATFFPTHDSVYLLMYGCFILNNDVHSKALKKNMKMTRERFILNHQGTPGLESVSDEYLGQLYDDIKQTPLPLKGWDGEATAVTSSVGGFLSSMVSAMGTKLCAARVVSSQWFNQLTEGW